MATKVTIEIDGNKGIVFFFFKRVYKKHISLSLVQVKRVAQVSTYVCF
jgi:hypothetical protein